MLDTKQIEDQHSPAKPENSPTLEKLDAAIAPPMGTQIQSNHRPGRLKHRRPTRTNVVFLSFGALRRLEPTADLPR
jgi:hypothetical protein